MTFRRLIPLTAILAAAGLVLAQPPAKKGAPESKKEAVKEVSKPAPGSLEDTLDKALRNSAEIKAAEAKVRDAEAELNRVRQQVLTKATAVHVDLTVAKRMLAVAEQTLAIHKAGLERGANNREAFLAAEAMVEKQRGEVEKLETELKSLRGEFAVRLSSAALSPDGRVLYISSADGSVGIWDAENGKALRTPAAPPKSAPAVQPPMLDRVKKLLNQEIEFAVENVGIVDALQGLLLQTKSDIPLRVLLPEGGGGFVTLKGKLTVGAWIEAIEDSDPDIRLVVRDYGLLLTTKGGVPDGALRVQDVWKGNYAELKKTDAPKQ